MKNDTALASALQRYSQAADFLDVELTDPRQKGIGEDTPLHMAAQDGRDEDIELFLDHGCDVNEPGDLGYTPLHFAVMGGHLDTARLLLSHGADLEAKNEFGETAIGMAPAHLRQDVSDLISEYAKRK